MVKQCLEFYTAFAWPDNSYTGSGWRRDVVKQCLEFPPTSLSSAEGQDWPANLVRSDALTAVDWRSSKNISTRSPCPVKGSGAR